MIYFIGSELFIVTKLPPYALRPENVEDLLKQSLKKLQLDYVDLYLIHHPFGLKYPTGNFSFSSAELDPTTDHVAVWKVLPSPCLILRKLNKAVFFRNWRSKLTKDLLKRLGFLTSTFHRSPKFWTIRESSLVTCKSNAIYICNKMNWLTFAKRTTLLLPHTLHWVRRVWTETPRL